MDVYVIQKILKVITAPLITDPPHTNTNNLFIRIFAS